MIHSLRQVSDWLTDSAVQVGGIFSGSRQILKAARDNLSD